MLINKNIYKLINMQSKNIFNKFSSLFIFSTSSSNTYPYIFGGIKQNS
jgi:hypothetical protein